MRNVWTHEKIEFLKNNHGIMSHDTMAEKIGISSGFQVARKAKKIGLGRSNYDKVISKKYSHNRLFFQTPSLTNCYLAGYFAADGSLGRYNDGYRFAIKLSTKDKEQLELIKNMVEYNGPIKYAESISPSSDTITYSCRFDIHNCIEWHEDLRKNFNIIPNKASIIRPPNFINFELECAFLIGLLDGDGSICVTTDNGERPNIVITLYSSSFDIIQYFKQFTDKNFGDLFKKTNWHHRPNSDSCKSFSIKGYRAGLIVDFFRKINVPYLPRKLSNPRVLEVLEFYKNKRPEFYDYQNYPRLQETLNKLKNTSQ